MKQILFLPIDIELPQIEFPTLENVRSNLAGSSFWTYENLAEDNKIKPDLGEHKIVFKEIIDQLPFIDIHIARLSVQDKIVNPHLDVNLSTHQIIKEDYDNIKKNEPSGYRIVIQGSPVSLKLLHNNRVISTQLPKIPMIYVINSTELLHFVDQDIGRKSLYIRGTIDEEKHRYLIDRSLKKYHQFCIYDD